MMTRDVLLEMELEEDDEEDGYIGERGVSPGPGWVGGRRGAGHPSPKSSAHAARTRGLRVGAAPTLGEGGCWDPRQVGGGGTGRRKPAPPACGRNAVASSRLPAQLAAGGLASGRPRERTGRRGSPRQFRDGRGTRALIGHRRYREAPARGSLDLGQQVWVIFSGSNWHGGFRGASAGCQPEGGVQGARPGKESRGVTRLKPSLGEGRRPALGRRAGAGWGGPGLI